MTIRWLSEEIANSPVLAPFRPLELVACGGFVAVTCLRNRSESHDLDYFLNKRTFGRQYDAVKTEMKRLIRKIADNLHFVPDWANDEITTFLSLLNNPEALFIESKQQGDVLHSDNNLVIYAAKWEWVLARKLKRLQGINRAQSPDDWLDCISIATLLYIKNGRSKLSPRILQSGKQEKVLHMICGHEEEVRSKFMTSPARSGDIMTARNRNGYDP
ncbi:hypothetical protein D6C91_00529 [Aureobasidium pullulans]|uniref:Uncharacterized protein n=1 Tax=Aureobasidium pullulans TaxID=5580 RepID=A0A4S9U4P4_AURPU|nr:hypothetical protein D6C91_00529 [Aureobasidium pullulans]